MTDLGELAPAHPRRVAGNHHPPGHPLHRPIARVGGGNPNVMRPGDVLRRPPSPSHEAGRSGLLSLLGSPAALVAARSLRTAGATRDQAVNFTAIAGRESSWNPLAHTYGAGCGPGQCRQPRGGGRVCEDSYGLWQINRCAHPQFTPAELRTPNGNAAAAREISGHFGSLEPWRGLEGVTSTHFAVARAAVAIAYAGSGGGGGGDTTPHKTQAARNLARSMAAFAAIQARFPGVRFGGICNCRHQRGTGSDSHQWSVHSVCGAVDVWPEGNSANAIIAFAESLPMVWGAWLDASPGDVHVQVIPNPPANWTPACASTGTIPGTGGVHNPPLDPNVPASRRARTVAAGLPSSCAEKQTVKATGGGLAKPVNGKCPPGSTIVGGFCLPERTNTAGGGAFDFIGDIGSFFGHLPVYLKIAAGGVLLLGGTAVLLVAATGGTRTTRRAAAATLRLPGVRTVAAGRTARRAAPVAAKAAAPARDARDAVVAKARTTPTRRDKAARRTSDRESRNMERMRRQPA